MAFGTISPGGGGSDPTFTTLTIGQVPKSDGSQLIYGGATVDPTTLEWTFDESINVPSGSVKVGEVLQLTEGTADLVTVDLVDNQMAFVTRSNFDDSVGAAPPFYIDYGGAQTLTLQATDTTVITANPLDFQLTGTVIAPDVRLVDQITFRANGPMTNARMRIMDNATGLTLRYIPSKTDFNAGIGFSLITGDNTFFLASNAADTAGNFHLGYQPFVVEAGQLLDFRIEGDTVDLLGNASNIPFIQVEAHDGPPTSIGGNVRAAANLTDNHVVLGAGGINVKEASILTYLTSGNNRFLDFNHDVAFTGTVGNRWFDSSLALVAQIDYDYLATELTVDAVVGDLRLDGNSAVLLTQSGSTIGFISISSVGDETVPLMNWSRSGTQSGAVNVRLSDRTPIGNALGASSDISIEDSGTTSDWWIHKGASSNSADWFPFVSGPNTATVANTIAIFNATDGGTIRDIAQIAASGGATTQFRIGTSNANGSSALIFEDDLLADLADLTYSHALNRLVMTSTTTLIIEAQGGNIILETGTGDLINLLQSGGLNDPVFEVDRSGANGASFQHFVANVTPTGNTTGNPGDMANLVSGVNSGVFIHLGSSATNTDWRRLTTADAVFTLGSIPFADSSGHLIDDNANLNYADATDTATIANLHTSDNLTNVGTDEFISKDSYLFLGSEYVTPSPRLGGLVVNHTPTTPTTTVSAGAFVAGIAATSNPTVAVVAASGFLNNDIIHVTGSANNDGVYEVSSHAANVLTIKGVGTIPTVSGFAHDQFVANASDSATITRMVVGVLEVDSIGIWAVALGAATDALTFSDLISTNSGLSADAVIVGGGIADVEATAHLLAPDNFLTMTPTASDEVLTFRMRNFAETTLFSIVLDDVTADTTISTFGVSSSLLIASPASGTAVSISSGGAINLQPGTFVDVTATTGESQLILRMDRSGAQPGDIDFYAQNRSPLTLPVTAEPGALDIENTGITSKLWINVGASGSTGTWVPLVKGPATATVDNKLMIWDGVTGAQAQDNSVFSFASSGSDRSIDLINDVSSVGNSGYRWFTDGAQEVANIEFDYVNDELNIRNLIGGPLTITSVNGLEFNQTGLTSAFDFESASNLSDIQFWNRTGTNGVIMEWHLSSAAPSGGSDGSLWIRRATTNTDLFMNLNGTWTGIFASIAASNELSEVLSNGNTTGGTDIVITSGDAITTTGSVTAINLASTATTANVVSVSGDSLTTGGLATFSSASANISARNLVTISNTNVASVSATGLFINQDADAPAIMIDAECTTDHCFEIDADALTIGTIARFTSDSANTGTRSLIEITNDNVLATGTTALHVQQDSTGLAADFEGNVRINGKLTVTGEIDPTHLVLNEQITSPTSPTIGVGNLWVRADVPNTLMYEDDAGNELEVVGLTANPVHSFLTVDSPATTQIAFTVIADSLTTGTAISVTSDSVDTSARTLGIFHNDNVLATSTQCLHVIQDADHEAVVIDGPGITSDTGVYITCSALEGGDALRVEGNSANHTSYLFRLHNFSNNAASKAMIIDHDSPDAAVEIFTDTEVESSFFIRANSLTTGSIAEFLSNSADTSIRNLVEITNDNVLATGTRCLTIQQDAATTALVINQNANAKAIDIETSTVTTGIIFDIESDGLTTGRLARLLDSSADTSTRDLVTITNSSALATGTTCLNVTNNSTGNAATFNGDVDINSTLTINDGNQVTTSTQAGGNVSLITANSLTSGTALRVESSSVSGFARNIVEFAITAASPSGVVLDLNQAGTDKTLNIVTASTDIQAIDIRADSLTTGEVLNAQSNSASTATRYLFVAWNSNPLATNARCLRLIQDSTHTALAIEADTTVQPIIDIDADSLTTGNIINASSNSASTSTRSLVNIINDNTAAVNTTLLTLRNDAIASAGDPALDVLGKVTVDTGDIGVGVTGFDVICNNVTGSGATIMNVAASTSVANNCVVGSFRQDDATNTGTIALFAQNNEIEGRAIGASGRVQIDSQNLSNDAMLLNYNSVTTGTGINLNISGLTTGTAIDVGSNSANVSARSLVLIDNQNAAAVGAIPLTVDNGSTGPLIELIRSGATVEIFADDATAVGNITGDPGDVNHLESGVDSDIQVHIGSSANNTDWAGCVGGPAILTFGSNDVSSTTTTRYLGPGIMDSQAATSVDQMTIPRDGFLRNMYLFVNGPGGNGNTIVYTVRINSVASALTVSMASTAATGSDTTNVVSVSEGDEIDVEITKALGVSTGPDEVRATMEFV